MAPDDNSGARPAGPVVLRIKLRYDDVETMVQRFAPNVGKSGLFLPTKSIQPVGTEVKFELRLSNDTAVLVGLGRVKQVRPPDPAAPKAAFGMAIELMRVSKEGRELIIKMIERRRAMGMADVTIPVPEDVDAARRAESDSQRADASGVVREAMANFASAPVAESVLSQAPPSSGPIGVAKPAVAPVAAPAAAPLMTSARESGQIPTATVDTSSGRRMVASLAPERTKTKRPRMADLIAKAGELTGPLATAPLADLDEHVDVQRALVRARALAGSDIEAELAALHDVAAAPLEISIEAASAELARQLGGKPIARRDRSAKWVAPPAVEMRTRTDAPATTTPATTTPATTSTPSTEHAPAPAAVAEPTPAAVAEPPAAAADAFARTDDPPARADDPPARTDDPPARADEPRAAVAETAEPVAVAAPRTSASPTRDRHTRGRAKRKASEPAITPPEPTPAAAPEPTPAAAPEPTAAAAPEPPPAAALDDPPTVIPEGPDLSRPDPHEAFAAKTRAETEASPSSVLAAISAPNVDPALWDFAREEDRIRATLGTRDDVPTATAAALPGDEPDYAFDEKTRIPTGDELADALRSRSDRRSFSNIDDESLRTEPGNRPSSSLLIDDSADAAMLERALEGSQPAMRLSDADIEPLDEDGDSDRTHIGQMPDGNPFADHGAPTYANPHAEQLARQLDQQLAEAEAEADDDFREIHAQRYDEGGEEVSDFDVLAEADEADADLLSAHGEADVAQPATHAQPGQDDFAARLDLDDDDPAAEFDERHHYAAPSKQQRAPSDVSYTVAERMPQAAPPFSARPVGEDFDEPPGFSNVQPTTPGSLRYAAAAHSEDLEDALAALDVDLDDNAADQRRRRGPSNQPRPLPGLPAHRPGDTGPSRTVKPTAPPPIPAGARKSHTTPPPMPVRQPPKRATTDEGVLIDFDDDE
jgi:hypothetical protein